jgi:hypothetical protein
MKNIPQANQTCGLEISTGQTKNSLAAGHRTTANFEHCHSKNKFGFLICKSALIW